MLDDVYAPPIFQIFTAQQQHDASPLTPLLP